MVVPMGLVDVLQSFTISSSLRDLLVFNYECSEGNEICPHGRPLKESNPKTIHNLRHYKIASSFLLAMTQSAYNCASNSALDLATC
jgi:hypothetical protein